jgi:hypothetical protein
MTELANTEWATALSDVRSWMPWFKVEWSRLRHQHGDVLENAVEREWARVVDVADTLVIFSRDLDSHPPTSPEMPTVLSVLAEAVDMLPQALATVRTAALAAAAAPAATSAKTAAHAASTSDASADDEPVASASEAPVANGMEALEASLELTAFRTGIEEMAHPINRALMACAAMQPTG